MDDVTVGDARNQLAETIGRLIFGWDKDSQDFADRAWDVITFAADVEEYKEQGAYVADRLLSDVSLLMTALEGVRERHWTHERGFTERYCTPWREVQDG